MSVEGRPNTLHVVPLASLTRQYVCCSISIQCTVFIEASDKPSFITSMWK